MNDVILVTYSRLSMHNTYNGRIEVFQHLMTPEGISLEPVKTSKQFYDLEMSSVIMLVHLELLQHPECVVRLKQVPDNQDVPDRRLPTFELDTYTRNLIRDDLLAAQKMFSPIVRTISGKENSHASE